MNLKTMILAGATALSLAAPAAAFADPYWGHDRDRRETWRDRDDWRRHEAWEHRGYAYGYGRRCFIEDRGYYGWHGHYVSRLVRVCR
jgi:hypothetical protein